VDNTPNPPTPPKPTETRIPKDTIPLDYKDMLIPRKKTQDEATRKEAVDSVRNFIIHAFGLAVLIMKILSAFQEHVPW